MAFIPQNRFITLFVALCGVALGTVTLVKAADVPRGVFSLGASGRAASSIVLANPDVAGISVRYGWRDLEPSENVYKWDFLDSEVARAAAAGKQVFLRIETQAGKPDWVTAAVVLAGGTFFTFTNDGVTTTIPVFWDPTYLAKKKAMIAALGSHFTNNPAVTVVCASFANANTEDWSVPHTNVDIANWFAAGYTSAKLLDAGQQIIDATMRAFPNQFVALSIGGNGHAGATGNLDPTAEYVPATAIAAANASWPGRLIVQINSLSTFNPVAPAPPDSAWNVLWSSQPNVAAQMVWCSNDPSFRVNAGIPIDSATALTLSINKGVSYGTKYIEIYQADVVNLPSVISYAKELLTASRAPIQTFFANVSTRAHVQNGDSVMVGGFIITGDVDKEVVLRGLGPSLASASLRDILPDPILELYDSTGALIAQNDNWKAPLPADVVASGLQPSYPAESLIAITLPPGHYTAALRGAAGSTGVGLCELYDLAPTNSRIANISTRGHVGTGDEAMIGGFIVGGSSPITALIRAIAPSLSGLGISGALPDPVLELRNSDGSLIFANDNWRTNQEKQIIDSSLPPSDDREAAIIVTLPQGNYTAIVRGVDNSTGIALVEAYNLETN